MKAQLEQLRVDTAGVVLQADRPLIVRSSGDTQEGNEPFASTTDRSPMIEIPAHWTAQVLLLSGVSPFVARAAAFCKAARAARRQGAIVVLDLDVRWRLWRGKDPRTVHMILREVDVVWGSAEDLFGLNLDAQTLASLLRMNAVFAGTDGAGAARARGAFGEVVRTAKDDVAIPPVGEGDAIAIAICTELARAQTADFAELWARALERGYLTACSPRPASPA